MHKIQENTSAGGSARESTRQDLVNCESTFVAELSLEASTIVRFDIQLPGWQLGTIGNGAAITNTPRSK